MINKAIIFVASLVLLISCTQQANKTKVSIQDDKFYINGEITYKGAIWEGNSVEGLLMNSRMVQGIFDDLNPETKNNFKYPDTQVWDANRNTDEFVSAMASWREHGLLAFTLNMQGGSPMGYGNHGWINSAYTEKGELRPEYMQRLEKILNQADELGMVVILGYLYFGQDQHLADEQAVIAAVDNLSHWILSHGYENVLAEIANECDIYYDHEIIKPARISELIERVKKLEINGKRLLVSTSYSGCNIPSDEVAKISDFILIHGNGADEPATISELVKHTRALPSYTSKPILFNEDDHFNFEQDTNNFANAVRSYASWGYFDFRMEGEAFEDGFQSMPADWEISSERKKAFFNKLKEITSH